MFREEIHMFGVSFGHTDRDAEILHSFWDSSGHMAGDAEIWPSRPVVYPMDENRICVNFCGFA